MEKQRKLELVKQFTEILNEVKQEWVKEVIADGEEVFFEDFKLHIKAWAKTYLEDVDFTEEEQEDFNPNGTVRGDLQMIVEIVLGQIWLEW